MPRDGRLVIAGYPHHIRKDAHSLRRLFKVEDDFRYFLGKMCDAKKVHGVQVHGWALLPKSVHLLVTPGPDPYDLSSFMKNLSRDLTLRRNRHEECHGTLWSDRFRSSVVQPGVWVTRTLRYLEHLPVQRKHVSDAMEYPWTSLHQRLGQVRYPWFDADPDYLNMGDNNEQRRRAWRAAIQAPMDEKHREHIEQAVFRCQLTGDSAFYEEVHRLTGTPVSNRGPGRPKSR